MTDEGSDSSQRDQPGTPLRYRDHLDVLTALIVYLALSKAESRTPLNLARDLALSDSAVLTALDGFPGIFRRSTRAHENGSRFYTLHARYALRHASDRSGEAIPELRAELLKTLLEFVNSRAQAEIDAEQFRSTLRRSVFSTWVACFGAVIAAAAAITAAVLSRQ